MSDWENSEPEEVAPQPAKVVPAKAVKWEGEDEDENGVASDWEDSSDDDKAKKPVTTTTAAPKKKGTLKQKLAQKEAERAARIAAGDFSDGEDAAMHPREKARLAKERELEADLKNAADLFGGVRISSGSTEIDQILQMDPKTKEEFEQFSSLVIEHIIKRHESKPLYHVFVEHHARELAYPLKDLEVRKAASALTTLANEKQKEQRDKASGKKKPKTAAKGTLGSNKALVGKIDTTAYDEALDDFGQDQNDFM